MQKKKASIKKSKFLQQYNFVFIGIIIAHIYFLIIVKNNIKNR